MPWWGWLVVVVGALGIIGWAGLVYLLVQMTRIKLF